MSTTQEFFASGAGNGFSHCLDRVDVSDYDYWITLGGYKKGDTDPVTEAQIAASFLNAYKMFWLMSKITGEASVDTIDITEAIASDSSLSRVCKKFTLFSEYQELESTPDENFVHRRASISGGAKIVRMYNGVTTDELNFVGYGVKFGPSAFAAYSSEGSGLSLVTASYMEDVPSPQASTDYATLSGVDLVCEVFDGNPFSSSAALEPENLTATVSGLDYTLTTTLTAMEFFTFT
jgi:hypothetical protein